MNKTTVAIYNKGFFASPEYINETFKEIPIDYYFRSSSQSTTDVNFNLRNNYIYSDLGWFVQDWFIEKKTIFSNVDVQNY